MPTMLIGVLHDYLDARLRMDKASANSLEHQFFRRLRQQLRHEDWHAITREISNAGQSLENLARLLGGPQITAQLNEWTDYTHDRTPPK